MTEDRPRTPGEIIDDLGTAITPAHRAVIEQARSAIVIFTGPARRIPEADSLVIIPAGRSSLAEAIGLLDMAKAHMMSAESQRQQLEAYLASGEPS